MRSQCKELHYHLAHERPGAITHTSLVPMQGNTLYSGYWPCVITCWSKQMQLRTLVPMQGDTLYNAHASVNTCRRKQLQFRRWSQCKAMHCTMSNQMQLRARHVQCACSLDQMPEQAAVSVVYQAHCPGIMKVCNYAILRLDHTT